MVIDETFSDPSLTRKALVSIDNEQPAHERRRPRCDGASEAAVRASLLPVQLHPDPEVADHAGRHADQPH